MALPDTTLRGAELPNLVDLLKRQADVKYDVVVTADKLEARDGRIRVRGGAARITDDGITEEDAVLVPTDVCDEGLAEKLGIPRAYLRTLRATKQGVTILTDDHDRIDPRLDDLNVNGWLQSNPGRKFLVRGFRTDDPDELGIARAFLSDRYAPIDNYDVLLATLDGVRQAGVGIEIHEANLTERNMRVAITAPEVSALAPALLANYRSPFGGGIERVRDLAAREGMGYEPGQEPVVFGGFEIRNSETGGGAFSIVPRLVVQICRNGLTVRSDAVKAVHVGGRLEEGQIRWSEDTEHRALELVKAKVRDAVTTFLSADYVANVLAGIEADSGTPVSDAAGTIERVTKAHGFSEAEAATILDCFIKSGDLTAGGVMQAVTATAQTIEDPDRAADLEDAALDVLATAAR